MTTPGPRAGTDARHVRHDGTELYAEAEGEGAPMLLLHGGLRHMGAVAGLRAHLLARGRHRVALMDGRGMGRSAMGPGTMSYRRAEEDALAVLDALGIGAVSVVGASDGGIVAMRMAARGDGRVRAFATVGSRWRAADSRHLWADFERTPLATLSDEAAAQVVRHYERLNPDRDFDRLGRALVAMWRDAGPDGHPGDRVDAISTPMLVAVGDRDPVMPLAACAELRGRVPPSEPLVVPRAGHAAFAERADVLLPALDSLLDRAAG